MDLSRRTVSDVSVCRAIHGLTVSGILVGMMALVAVLDKSPRGAVLLLTVAQIIDGVDGPLARKWDIGRVLPKYDGYIMDLVIDFVTCVFVPAVFAWQFVVVSHDAWGEGALALMLASSALWFSRTDMMTDDKWFRGFPAVWNLVIPTLWLLDAPHGVSVGVIIALSVLSLTDVEFAHPIQAAQWRRENIAFMALWIVATVVLTYRMPTTSFWTDVVLLLGPAWVVGSTAVREIDRRRRGARDGVTA